MDVLGPIIILAVIGGIGYFVYTRVMKKKAEAGQPRPANPARRHPPAPTTEPPEVEPPVTKGD